MMEVVWEPGTGSNASVFLLSKVAVGAAFASEFFAKYPLLPRVIILIAPFLLIWLGIWLQPSKKELESP